MTIDTLRADRVGAYGYAAGQTPVLDRLAREGVLLEDAVVQVPQTRPSHASILTGRYPLRFDIRAIFPDDDSHLPRGTVTLPALLKANGYGTTHVGKWHLGGLHVSHAENRSASIPGPHEHGFDHYLCHIEQQPLRGNMIKERRLYREGGTCLLRNDQRVTESDPCFRMHFTDIIGAESIPPSPRRSRLGYGR